MKTLFALILLASPALAQDLVGDGPIRTVAHEVGVEIHDRIAATSVTQVFENLDGQQREGAYVFAVPAGASIVEFQMWIDGRIMKGEMVDRQRAEQIYRSIVERKKDPGIVDHVRDNVWRVRVFPIPPHGGVVKFLTRYVEVLPCVSGQTTYTLPFSIPEEKARKMDSFSIRFDVHSSAPVTAVEGAGLSVAKKSPTQFTAIGDCTNISFTKDLVMKFDARPAGRDLAFSAHRVGEDDGYFLLQVLPGLAGAATDRVPREVIYLLDTSASMDEKLFRRLVLSIADGLRELGPQDRFNIHAFNTDVTRFQKGPVEPSGANLRAASAFLDKLRPQGRTDLGKALMDVASQKPSVARLLFVISDGSLSAGCLDPAVVVKDAAEAFKEDTVVYGIQVGLTFDRTLESLARRSGGECMTGDEKAVEQAFRAAQKRFSRPVLTNARYDFGGAEAHDVFAPRLLFADEPILVIGRYHRSGTHQVTLTGQMADRDVRIVRSFEFPELHEGWASSAYVWAGRRIGSLLDELFLSGESDAIRGAVVALSKEHRIMTPYTAFLVLENDSLYAQNGLRQAAGESQPLFIEGRPRTRKINQGKLGLPDPVGVKILDPLASTADTSLLQALRWIASNQKQFTSFRAGEIALSATGVSALALEAVEGSGAFELNPQDKRSFGEALTQLLSTLRQAQKRNGQIGETIFDHVFSAEALARVALWHPQLAGPKEMLQKAVSWMCDQPGLLDQRGIAALAAPVLVMAKDLRLEIDASTIRLVEKSVEGAGDAFYVRAQMSLDPKAAVKPRVAAAARRLAEKGPADPLSAYLGTTALAAWGGINSLEWKAWQRKMESFKHTAGGDPNGNTNNPDHPALSTLLTLALEEMNDATDRR